MQTSDTTIIRDAARWAENAMRMLARMQSSASVAVQKDEADIATTADLASEKYLISKILTKYPHHNILTEETGFSDRQGEYTWVIDPLDGTKEYAKGGEDYGILLAVEKRDDVIGGCTVIYAHSLSVYTCLKDGFARYNGKPAHVSVTGDPAKAYVSFHLPSRKNSGPEKDAAFSVVRACVDEFYRVRINYNEARALGWVGRGILDAHVILPNLGTKWWDIAPQLVFVEESGGKISDITGGKIRNRDMSRGIIASNGLIHEKLMGIIQRYYG